MRCNLEIGFGDETLWLDAAGAVFWPAAQALIVSDLHLEKASFLSQFGALLPHYDTRATLDKLAALIAHYRPARVICLGDSFHDAQAFARLAAHDRSALMALIAQTVDWHWVLGNHDPLLAAELPGARHATLRMHDILLSHEPEQSNVPQIIGHFHPKLSLSLNGHRVSGPAFVKDHAMMIMPAFGSFTGGLSAHDKAIASLLTDPTHYILYRERIWQLR